MKNLFAHAVAAGLLCLLAGCDDRAEGPTAPPVSISGPAFTEGGCVRGGYCPLGEIAVTVQGPSTPPDADAQEDCPYTSLTECNDFEGGGTSGGGTASPEPEPEPCDPAIHPDCEKPLTAQDSASLAQALKLIRPQSAFTDSLARKACAQMEQWLRTAWSDGDVMRGAFDSDSTNDPLGSHFGMYDRGSGNLHIDPSVLDDANGGSTAALTELAITALHEAAHWAGFAHTTAPTFDAQGRDHYVDQPFRYLNPGENSCVPR